MANYPKCGNCDKDMRPRRAHAADHPGTVQAGGADQCNSCYKVALRARKNAVADPRVQANRANTEAFLQRIRATQQRKERQARVRMVIR